MRAPLLLLLAPAALAQVERSVLTPSTPQLHQHFGQAVDIDGGVVLVGAAGDDNAVPNAGAGFLFDAFTGAQTKKLVAPVTENASLGQSAAIDGGWALLGAPLDVFPSFNSGSVALFDVPSGALIAKLRPAINLSGSLFGWDVDVEGDLAVIGARGQSTGGPSAGAAYLFDVATQTELLQLVSNNLKPGDGLGWSVDLDGDRALVGAPYAGPNDEGAAYLFDTTTGAQLRKFTAVGAASGDAFGLQVVIEGDYVAVAGFPGPLDHGAVWVFDANTGAQLHRIDPPDHVDDYFGYDLALDDGVLVVGTPQDWWDFGLAPPGRVYLYDVATAELFAELRPSDSQAEDVVGWRVAVDDRHVAVTKGYGEAYVHCVPTAVGTRYCSPAELNSSGLPAELDAFGATVTACQDLVLTASSVPANQFGYFVASETQGFVPNVGGGQGTLCLGGTIARFNDQTQNSAAAGTFSIRVDLAAIPTTPVHAVQPGETWNFQGWFRDKNPHNTWNFTDAVAVTFE